MGRKSNLRKKFKRLKIRNEDEGKGVCNNNRACNEEGERIIVDNADSEDRISNLPERALTNILSRLEIEEAVRTCILSRNWVNKWTSICNLKLCDGFPFPKKNFLNFVEWVLNKNLCVKELTLVCFHNQDQSRVKALISAALNSDVLESLCVSLLETVAVFVPCFFYSNSLTKLELNSCIFGVSVEVCFNHLRTLKLHYVVFLKPEVSSSRQLLFNMPILEEFELNYCMFLNVSSLKIDAPFLSSFEVIQCCYDCPIGFEINGGSSTNFTYSGSLMETFTFSNPAAVSCVSLKIRMIIICVCQHFLDELGSQARLVLEKFSASLQKLKLSEDVIRALGQCQPAFPLPMFNKLKHVEVPLLWFANDCLNNSAVDLLKNAPVLETLTISSEEFRLCRKCKKSKKSKRKVSKNENYLGIRSLPSSFLSHLKSVKFKRFRCCDAEIQLMKFLVLLAPVLEESIIHCTGLGVAKKLEDQFLMIPIASANLKIVYVCV